MDEISGNNSAELLDDGSIEIELAYHNGDQPVLKTKRQTLQQPDRDVEQQPHVPKNNRTTELRAMF